MYALIYPQTQVGNGLRQSCQHIEYVLRIRYNLNKFWEDNMANAILKTKEQQVRIFTPKMSNFETSSRYEGLSLKKENEGKSIKELQLKYAR